MFLNKEIKSTKQLISKVLAINVCDIMVLQLHHIFKKKKKKKDNKLEILTIVYLLIINYHLKILCLLNSSYF